MKNKINHIIFSGMLLMASVGITVNLHYCDGELYSFAVDGNAKNCCTDDHHFAHNANDQHKHACHTSGKDTDNCHDESVIFKVVDNYIVNSTDFDFKTFESLSLFLNMPVAIIIGNYNDTDILRSEYNIHAPPLLHTISFLQIFLI